MMKRILIASLTLCCFLAASMNVVIASTTTLTDEIGDVVDFETGENATDKEYIDIKQVVCTRDYRQVTLKLTVEGVIEDKGDILIWRLISDEDYLYEYTANMTEEEIEELFLSMLEQDMVIYSFDLSTSNDAYQIIYTNSEVLIFDGEFNVIEGNESVSGGILTISFNLPSSKENLTDILVTTSELMNLGEESFMDELYGEIIDPLQSDGNDNGGDSNQDDSDSGSGLNIFIALIVIIVIAGVAVLVYVIRR